MNNTNSDSVSSEIGINQKHFICEVCKKEFFTKFHYQIHSVTHLLPEQFENCHECLEGSAHILNLDKHLEIHNNSACVNSMNEHGEKHNSDSTNRFITQQNTDDEITPTNNHNDEKHSANDRLQSLFRCDRCQNEFLEKHHLEEHYQNYCIKKELNADECDDFVSLSVVATDFCASKKDDVTSSEVPEKSKNIRVFTTKVHEKTNAYTQNFSKTTQFVCEVCQKVFSNKCSLIIHLSVHSDHKTFKCRLCEKIFTLKSLLSAHRRTHKVKKVFCGVCRKGFVSKEKLFNHVYIHALVVSFSCNICQMTFSEKALLEKHRRRHTAEKKFADEVKHGLSDQLQNLFKCDKCKKEFLKKNDLEEHYRIHSIKKEFDSDEYVVPSSSAGRKIFPSYKALHMDKGGHSQNSSLGKHNLTQTEGKKSGKYFTCDVCQKKFYSKRTLTDHKHIHLGSFPHVCNICSKGFARLDHLKRHYKIHSRVSQASKSDKKALNIHNSTKSVSSYVCDVCSKEFTRRNHLERHYVVHCRVSPKKLSSDFSYFCDFCSEGFTRPDHLYDHYQTHSGEKPLKCEICGTNYRHKRNFIKHQLTHQQRKEVKLELLPHVCSFCSKAFKRPDHLKRHLLIHTGEKPFKCETCNASFNQKGALTTHRSVHQRKESGILKRTRISKKKKNF